MRANLVLSPAPYRAVLERSAADWPNATVPHTDHPARFVPVETNGARRLAWVVRPGRAWPVSHDEDPSL